MRSRLSQKREETARRRTAHTANTGGGGGRLYGPHLAASATDMKIQDLCLQLTQQLSSPDFKFSFFRPFVTQSNIFLPTLVSADCVGFW